MIMRFSKLENRKFSKLTMYANGKYEKEISKMEPLSMHSYDTSLQ